MSSSFSKYLYSSWSLTLSTMFRSNSTSSYTSSDGSFRLYDYRNSMMNMIKPSYVSDSETETCSFYDSFDSFEDFMIGARDMIIAWGDTPRYWKWISLPHSRFAEVAQLHHVCWLDISVKIEATLLSSPKTTYVAYLVFKLTDDSYGFHRTPIETSVGMTNGFKNIKSINLISKNNVINREDGWMEIELGEVFVNGGDDDNDLLEVSVREVKRLNWKGGLIIEGIQFRPKV